MVRNHQGNKQPIEPSLVIRQRARLIIQHLSTNWFRGLVGYGICLTRITSPVRSWAESIIFDFHFQLFFHDGEYFSTFVYSIF